MRLDKRGQGWSWANIGAALLVIAVVVVMFFGPVDSLRAGTQSATNKTAEFGDALKALNIEKLTSMDRDELSEDEKALLAETLEANAKSLMDEARKNIDEGNYPMARFNLGKVNLNEVSPDTRKLIDELFSEINLKELFTNRKNIEDLASLKQKIIKLDTNNEEIKELLDKVNTALLSEYGVTDENPSNLDSEYVEWLNNDKKTYDGTITLARKFSGDIFDPRYVVLYRSASILSDGVGESLLADYFLANAFYLNKRWNNAVAEYEEILNDEDYSSFLEPSDKNIIEKTIKYRINELAKKGYASSLKWDIELSLILQDPTVFGWGVDYYEVLWPEELSLRTNFLNVGSNENAEKLVIDIPLDGDSWDKDFDGDIAKICDQVNDKCLFTLKLRLSDNLNETICTTFQKLHIKDMPELIMPCQTSSEEPFNFGIKLVDYYVGSENENGNLTFEFNTVKQKEYPFKHEFYEVDMDRILPPQSSA